LQRRAGEVNTAVMNWIDTNPSPPFFLFVHYFDPHQPYQPPAPYDRLINETDVPEITGSMEEIRQLRIHLAERREPDNRIERLHELYLGEIVYTDRSIGELIRYLKNKRLYDSSLVVLTTDHGETFWEHPDRENIDHGYMVYETTTHVPLIFRWPGRIESGRSGILASNIDVAPTILDLAGFEIPTAFRGRSLADVPNGVEYEPVPVFSEATKPYGKPELGTPFRNDRKAKCVMTDGWKYIWMPLVQGREELYNLSIDPDERTDLSRNESELDRLPGMRHLVQEWMRDISDVARKSAAGPDSVTRSKLEALGYVE
jgi:arylsulfatase A-like enzyme